jgi:hypothetical protein
MRCREHRRADLHSSQIDDLRDHLVRPKLRDLTTAIVQGITGWYRDQLPNPLPVQPHPSQYCPKALTDQNALSAGAACTGHLPGLQTV